MAQVQDQASRNDHSSSSPSSPSSTACAISPWLAPAANNDGRTASSSYGAPRQMVCTVVVERGGPAVLLLLLIFGELMIIQPDKGLSRTLMGQDSGPVYAHDTLLSMVQMNYPGEGCQT